MSASGVEVVVEHVAETVARCRRRTQLVSAVRRAGVTIPLAIVAVEIVAIATAPSPARLLMLTAVAVALAAIAAAISSILRAPTLRATAVAIDARLLLQDRIVTALQLVNDHDPMARLVVRDAAARLATVSPARVFPLEAPLHFHAALVATAVATIVFLVMTTGPGRFSQTPRGTSNGARGAGAGRSSSRSAGPASDARKAIEGVASSASAPQSRTSNQTAANRGDTPVGRESLRNETETGALARGSTAPRAADSRAGASGRDAGSAAGTGDGGRGATRFADRTASAAGGVSGAVDSDAHRAQSRVTPATAPVDATYNDQYRLASARAQTAIAQERVPMRLRAYVKRYFVAIHP